MNPNRYKVYEHINKVNGKRYIGQTGLCLSDRFQGGKGYSNQERFYSDILKYGWQHFEHNLIKDGLTKEESKKLERDLITKYETWNPDKGYNTYGSDWVPDSNMEIRLDRPVICVETGIEYESIPAATKEMRLTSNTCILRVVNNPTRKSRGFHWVQLPIEEKEDK